MDRGGDAGIGSVNGAMRAGVGVAALVQVVVKGFALCLREKYDSASQLEAGKWFSRSVWSHKRMS